MTRRLVVLTCLALVLAACAVPRHRDAGNPSTLPVDEARVEQVLARYQSVRDTAAELLDAKPLSVVESGAVLAIDTGTFAVAQKVQGPASSKVATDIEQIATPRFTKYPLWFMVEVRDTADEVNRVQIFERASAVDPWLLAATPQTVLSTRLPELRKRKGAALAVPPTSAAGMSMSPQQVADAYADVLTDPGAEQAAALAEDDFIVQMREIAERNASLEGASFAQSWKAEEVTHALRTADGGALVFVTLERKDAYSVEEGKRVTWPKNSPQEALLEAGVSTKAELTYLHQVLVHVPAGSAKPRALGQHGGVVSADEP